MRKESIILGGQKFKYQLHKIFVYDKCSVTIEDVYAVMEDATTNVNSAYKVTSVNAKDTDHAVERSNHLVVKVVVSMHGERWC